VDREGDDQLHLTQLPFFEGAQEATSEHLVLGVTDVDAEDLRATRRGEPGATTTTIEVTMVTRSPLPDRSPGPVML
jgi:hypothetical protein